MSCSHAPNIDHVRVMTPITNIMINLSLGATVRVIPNIKMDVGSIGYRLS